MISPIFLKIVNAMPDKALTFMSKKIINKALKKYTNINVNGRENIDNLEAPIIFIFNHLSNGDGLVLQEVLKDKDVTFVAGVKLGNTNLTNLGLKFVKTIAITPNTADKDSIKAIIKHVKDGGNLGIFPEGTRSRSESMIEAKKGILLIAKMTGAKIVPVGVWGTENFMPINDKDMGGEKFQHADVNVNIGKPFYVPKKDIGEEKTSYESRALHYIMKQIADLLPESYRGVYRN